MDPSFQASFNLVGTFCSNLVTEFWCFIFSIKVRSTVAVLEPWYGFSNLGWIISVDFYSWENLPPQARSPFFVDSMPYAFLGPTDLDLPLFSWDTIFTRLLKKNQMELAEYETIFLWESNLINMLVRVNIQGPK